MKNKYSITSLNEVNIDQLIKELITPGIAPQNTSLTDFTPIYDYMGVSPITIILELTESEAQELKNNPLVENISEQTDQKASHFDVTRTINSTYSSTNNSIHQNWGMSRCNSISALPPWDNNFTHYKTGSGVDVLIIDSGIIPNHPEFLNTNGVSRLVKENWSYFYPITSSKNISVSFSYNNYVMNEVLDPTIYVVSDKPNGNGTTTYRTEVYSFNLDGSTVNDPLFIGPAIGAPFSSTYVSRNGATTGTVTLSVYGGNRSEFSTTQNVMYYWSGRNLNINGVITRTKYNTQTNDEFFYNDTNGHGTHCTGTVAGSAYGWATDARIYTMHIDLDNDLGGYSSLTPALIEVYNLILSWHNRKKLKTVFRPTVTNNSYGYDNNVLNDVNLAVKSLVDSGVHFIHSAGNSSAFITVPTDPTFNRYRVGSNNKNYISQENSPCWPNYLWSSQDNNPVICVGALGDYDSTRPHTRAIYSNYGPGVSFYAPGTWIVSSNYTNTGAVYPGSTSFFCIKYSGTSMAGPQVAGILATLLEDRPTLTPLSAKSLLIQNCIVGAISGHDDIYTGGGLYNNTRMYTLSGGGNLTLSKYPANYIVVDSANQSNFAKYLGNCYAKNIQVALSGITYNSSLYYMNNSTDLAFGSTCP